MNHALATAVGGFAAGLVGLGLGPGASSAAAETRGGRGGPLIVHEWGTFTNFAGSDGVQRPFTTGIGLEGDLPGFVYSYAEGGGSGEQVRIHGHKFGLQCTQRMETPVIYIYPGCRGPVDVEARLLEGTMTEFYPPLNGLGGGAGGGRAPG
ncbi:MAG: hypothetical protein IT438_13255 [Phycisphaerales bacterium]|nr:hypothetical protein [Phycisphaerales bacterium]